MSYPTDNAGTLPMKKPSFIARASLPITLALIAWLSPVGWAFWSGAELGLKLRLTGVPAVYLFAYMGAVLGAFSATAAIGLGYGYKKTRTPVYWPRLSSTLAAVQLVVTLAASLWIFGPKWWPS